MSAKNLSTVASDLIESYGNTAKNVIDAYRAGGERVVCLLEKSWNKALKQSRTDLSPETTENASAAQLAFSVYYTKGLVLTTNGAQHLVNQLVKAAAAGVERVAANASRFEEKTGLTSLNTLAKATAPSAVVLSKLAAHIEKRSAQLVSKVAVNNVTTASVKRSSAFGQKRRTKSV